jgi:hypothetical protein
MTENFNDLLRPQATDREDHALATKATELLRQDSAKATELPRQGTVVHNMSYLETGFNAVTSRIISKDETRETVNRLASDFVKTATLFTGGKLGLAGTFVAYGLDQASPSDNWKAQAADFALGAAKGEAMRGMFSVVGSSGTCAPLKGALMGLSSGAAEEVFKRQTFTDPSSLNDRLRQNAFNPQAMLMNAALFTAGQGLYSGINLATKGALAQNRIASGMVMGGSFGFVNGTVQEASREMQEKGSIDPGKVLLRGLLDGSVNAAAAGVGMKISDPVFQQHVKDSARKALDWTTSAGSQLLESTRSIVGASSTVSLSQDKPLKVVEVPNDPAIDSPDWRRPLPYKKGVPGEYMKDGLEPRTAPDPRVAEALEKIKPEAIKSVLEDISGVNEPIINGKPTRLESRSTLGKSYEPAMDYFKEKLAKEGFQVVVDTYTKNGEEYHNLRAIKLGQTKPNEIVMFGAHADSTLGYGDEPVAKAPGADDNGTGSAAISQMAKALKDLPLDRTVVLSIYSGEEQGLWGSRAMAEQYKQGQNRLASLLSNAGVGDWKNTKVIAMYSLDMMGVAPNSNTCEVHDTSNKPGPQALTKLLSDKASQYKLDLKVYGAHNDELNNRSDHYAWQRLGIPAVLVSEPYDTAPQPNEFIHTVNDTVDNINIPLVTNIAKAATAAGIELAGLLNTARPAAGSAVHITTSEAVRK